MPLRLAMVITGEDVMGLRQISNLLDDIPVRRVEGGDSWVDRANAEIGEDVFNRSMTGEELRLAYGKLAVEHRATADTAFVVDDAEMKELIDEVMRIREESKVFGIEGERRTFFQLFAVVLGMFMIAIGGVSLMIFYAGAVSVHETPKGYAFAMAKLVGQQVLAWIDLPP